MSEEVNEEEKKEEGKKLDVKSLVAVIPPAETLLKKERKMQEKRVRVRYGNVKRNQLVISKKLAEMLGIKDKAYLVVAGRKRFLLNVIINEELPENTVYANQELLQENGVADNSIATVRRAEE